MEYLVLTPKHLAVALKGRRKTLGLTQQDVAKQIGILPKTISLLESHPERCSLESLMKLLAVLGIELSLNVKQALNSHYEKGTW